MCHTVHSKHFRTFLKAGHDLGPCMIVLSHSLCYPNYFYWALRRNPITNCVESLDLLLDTEFRLSLALHWEKGEKEIYCWKHWVKKARDEIITPYGPWNVRISGCSVRLQGKSEAELLQRLPWAGAGWCDGRGGWCSGAPQKPGCSIAPLPHFPVAGLHEIKAPRNSGTLDRSGETQPAIVSVVNSHRGHRGQNGSLKQMWWWG